MQIFWDINDLGRRTRSENNLKLGYYLVKNKND